VLVSARAAETCRVVHQCFGPALSAIVHYNTGALALTPLHIASGVVYADTRCRVVGCVWITAVRPLETGRYARSYPAAASSLGQRLRPVLFLLPPPRFKYTCWSQTDSPQRPFICFCFHSPSDWPHTTLCCGVARR
jgi:hypothetical protein